MNKEIQFIPTFSLTPNKLVQYNTVYKWSEYAQEFKHISKFRMKYFDFETGTFLKNVITRSSHNFTISSNAYRTLQQKINWLYYLAKEKNVVTPKGNTITNHKISFITLTLPSKQTHPTKFITENLLNQFLTEIRGRFKMENYVWRLEFQKNGNVHYHIVTDTYIDFYVIKSIWNRNLAKHGYIKAYNEKMKNLSLLDYHKLYNFGNKVSFKINSERYAKGLKDNWLNPSTVDVKSVISNKAIAGYIAKYFSKDSNNTTIKNELDTEENSKNLRLWFCSRSLSKLGKVSDFIEAFKYDIFKIISQDPALERYEAKYAVIYNFDIRNILGKAKKLIDYILKKYAFDNKYLPWGVNYSYG